ncbi:hypothetical protein EASAB2608_06565 [Streptomyces sp. EAS-AB2608]|nr:hypothetical protein EASAB2608_06565 [Streptomyces sp. EAS-AB2608]
MWDLPASWDAGAAGPDVASHTIFTGPEPLAETIPGPPGVEDLRAEEGEVSGLKLFHMTTSGATEVAPRLAETEADVQGLVETHMETLLGVRFLASEYSTGPFHGGAGLIRSAWTRTDRP